MRKSIRVLCFHACITVGNVVLFIKYVLRQDVFLDTEKDVR